MLGAARAADLAGLLVKDAATRAEAAQALFKLVQTLNG
ncbi:hypothetical protein COLU111180_07150 [Cohnella lubricantis]|nr:hypothetical protein [Cohnella lubricantis]